MQPKRRQALRFWIIVSGDGVRGCHVCAVRVWIAEKVGECHGREGVGVVVCLRVEFDHFGCCSFGDVTRLVVVVVSSMV